MKAKTADEVKQFSDIPNIGKAMSADFQLMGIRSPFELKKQDPLKLYLKLGKLTGARQDPCVLDTFMAAVDFMNGAPAQPWWTYTPLRKKHFPKI